MDKKDGRIVYSVSDLNSEIKDVLEQYQVWVKGEVSEYKYSPKWYYSFFTLKDQDAQIRCVVRDDAVKKLKFNFEDGQEVLIYGQVSLYEARGDYQIKVSKIEEIGVGSLQKQLEELKAKLQNEGLFDEERKKPIPRFPSKVGVVTSANGAAFKDFKKVLSHRFQGLEIILKDTLVQGKKAASGIAKAIEEFNNEDEAEVLIVMRGGGSLEDLWCFNEEAVARAIFNSVIPVVSAVGHEKDVTISDLVSDHRSSTPSNAAEELVPHKDDLMRMLDEFYKKIQNAKENFRELPLKLDLLFKSIINKFQNFIENKNNSLDLIYKNILSLSPENVLDRGYSLVYRKSKLVKKASDVRLSDDLKVKLSSGGLFVNVKGKSKK